MAVADLGCGSPRLHAPDDDEGGRGLQLVDRVRVAWGTSHHDDGKLVRGRIGCAGTGFAC